MCLSYLRPEDVRVGLEQILAEEVTVALFVVYPNQLASFMTYFNSQWVPIIDQWNIFAIEDHTTNNDCEGWHWGIHGKLETS